MRRTSAGSRAAALLAAGALLLAAAACSGDSDDTTATTDGDGTTATTDDMTGTTTAGADLAEAQTVAMTAVDFGYEDAPSELEAGLVTVELTNAGAEEHQATIVQLNEGETFEQALGRVAQDPKTIGSAGTFYGGPNGVAPGETVSATAALEPGEYVFACFIPSPSDDIPHAAKGQVAPFTVTEGTEAEVPEADQEIGLLDFSFDVPEDLDASRPVTIVNEGEEPHEMTVYEIAEDATYEDVTAFFMTPPGERSPGPPPFSPVSGVAAMSVGRSNDQTLDLASGEYVLICFLPAAEDGLPHFLKGMIQPLSVT